MARFNSTRNSPLGSKRRPPYPRSTHGLTPPHRGAQRSHERPHLDRRGELEQGEYNSARLEQRRGRMTRRKERPAVDVSAKRPGNPTPETGSSRPRHNLEVDGGGFTPRPKGAYRLFLVACSLRLPGATEAEVSRATTGFPTKPRPIASRKGETLSCDRIVPQDVRGV
ncbi:hypothetical protein VTJ49DRAFT_2741 [Mycothermus thermophilus]|uniref:Uncharacterized protein n=1 Tax=Humicola insolens TaxID=85995 RepID=A0ABR3VP26_HUMIN